MKRFLIGLIFAAGLALAGAAHAGSWADDEVAGPANNAIIVDTGALTGGNKSVSFLVHSTLPGVFEFQHVDTDGTTVLHRQRVSVVSGQADFALTSSITITVAANQSLRIVSKQALTLGTVGASIWFQ